MYSREYELVLITRPDLTDEEHLELVARAEEIMSSVGGTVLVTNKWGKRKLAYEIEDFNKGYYAIISFLGDNAVLDELNHRLSIEDRVLRHLAVKVSDRAEIASRIAWGAQRREEIEAKEAEAAERAAARRAERAERQQQSLDYLGD